LAGGVSYIFGLGGTITIGLPGGVASVSLNIVGGVFNGQLPSGSGSYSFDTNGLLLNGNLIKTPAYFTAALVDSAVKIPTGSVKARGLRGSFWGRR